MTSPEILYIPDLAVMLNTTEAAIRSSLQRHREMLKQGKNEDLLPPTTRARGRRVCWRLQTVREWLAAGETGVGVTAPDAASYLADLQAPPQKPRRGRPRKIYS